jgi:hypothetical protein
MIFDAIKRLIHKRRHAYRALFLADDKLNPAARIVLTDLRRFCRATTSTTVVSFTSGMVDPIASAQAEGRREVWNRITQHLHVSDEDLYRLVEQETGTD